MNKFEGMIKKVAGYDGPELRDASKIEVRKDIRERAKFPPEIQDLLNKIDKLDNQELKLITNINEIQKNLKNNEDKAILKNLEEQLGSLEDEQDNIMQNLLDILSKDKKLYDDFMQYQLKKEDEENIEERKFSLN